MYDLNKRTLTYLIINRFNLIKDIKSLSIVILEAFEVKRKLKYIHISTYIQNEHDTTFVK